MSYVPLHVHSDFSFLDGYSSVDSHARRAASLGYNALGITDHGGVSGHLELQKAAKKYDIRPVFGMEGYFHPGAKHAVDLKLRKSDFSHITLLASTQTGLSNLWKWSTRGYVQSRDGRPIVDWDDMKELSEGIWASDGCLLGHFAKAVIAGDDQAQHELIGRYLDTFGERFFMELHTWQFLDPVGEEQHRLNDEMRMVNQAKVDFARRYGVPLTVVNDCHYASPEEWKKHSYVWNMNTKPNPDQTPEGQKADWLMEEGEIVHFMGRHGISEDIVWEAIANTQMIADSCDVEIKGRDRMPSATGSPDSDRELFYRLLSEGLQRKVVDRGLPEGPYLERLNYEIPVLTGPGFDGYFAVKADVIHWAKHEADILVGPGRGSVGGSLCAYLMDITEVDPLKYDLLFERFLNPEREDYPDIDTDFQQSRLKDVKKYLAGKYGEDHVCAVGTVATSKPKSMVTDLARGMKLGYDDYMGIKKDVAKLPVDIKWQELVENPSMEKWRDRFPDLFQEASEMLGMNRQAGTHPSAFLISSEPLYGNLPMRVKDSGDGVVEMVSQFDGDEVAELGYVKIDLLGNRNNDTLYEARKMVGKRHDKWLDYYNFGDEEYSDPSIWTQVAKGDSLGMFQLEADLMQDTATRFKPQSEREVAELLAINRPGVIDAKKLEPYINRKHGREEPDFDHPMMETIAGETYGILIYQEQLMKMAKHIAGFTPGEAEWLRKVVGKKMVDEIPGLKKQFFDGCLANREFVDQCDDAPEKVVQKLWASIEASSLYLFNKSHSVEYALTGAWQAYVRHYYYPEYITALMMTDEENIPKYVRHARKNGIEILPPDINVSGKHFTLTNEGIRYGLTAVRSVKDNAYNEIEKHRPFTSLDDLLDRTSKQKVNKSVVLNLIHIGAFDTLDADRVGLEQRYYEYMKVKPRDQKPIPDYTNILEMYRMEIHLVGSSLMYDPCKEHEDAIDDLCIQSPDAIEEAEKGDVLMVGGLISKIKEHQTKKGDPMAFLGIDYRGESYDVVAFPEAWQANKTFIEPDAPVVCRVSKTDRGVHLVQLVRLDMLDKEQ